MAVTASSTAPNGGTDDELAAALPHAAREIEEFVAGGGWNQPVQLFALVSTASLLAAEPGVASQVDASAPLTPVAQEPLAGTDLDVALAGIAWPDTVAGCAVVQEIVVLPPDAEAELSGADSDVLVRLAAGHPARREGRMVAAVLRGGAGACVLRLRGGDDVIEELVEHPELAPNLLDALRRTFAP